MQRILSIGLILQSVERKRKKTDLWHIKNHVFNSKLIVSAKVLEHLYLGRTIQNIRAKCKSTFKLKI